MTIALGLLALPIGTFVFGALLSLVHFVVALAIGGRYLGRTANFAPIGDGFAAVGGLLVLWPLCLVLGPIAIWTTYQLRSLVERG